MIGLYPEECRFELGLGLSPGRGCEPGTRPNRPSPHSGSNQSRSRAYFTSLNSHHSDSSLHHVDNHTCSLGPRLFRRLSPPLCPCSIGLQPQPGPSTPPARALPLPLTPISHPASRPTRLDKVTYSDRVRFDIRRPTLPAMNAILNRAGGLEALSHQMAGAGRAPAGSESGPAPAAIRGLTFPNRARPVLVLAEIAQAHPARSSSIRTRTSNRNTRFLITRPLKLSCPPAAAPANFPPRRRGALPLAPDQAWGAGPGRRLWLLPTARYTFDPAWAPNTSPTLDSTALSRLVPRPGPPQTPTTRPSPARARSLAHPQPRASLQPPPPPASRLPLSP